MSIQERLRRVRVQCALHGVTGPDADVQEIKLDFMSIAEAMFDVSAKVTCGSVKLLPLLEDLSALLIELRGGAVVVTRQKARMEMVS